MIGARGWELNSLNCSLEMVPAYAQPRAAAAWTGSPLRVHWDTNSIIITERLPAVVSPTGVVPSPLDRHPTPLVRLSGVGLWHPPSSAAHARLSRGSAASGLVGRPKN